MAKRIVLFLAVNFLVVITLSLLLKFLGIQPYLQRNHLDITSLAMFSLVWGMGGAFISLGLSRIIAKWSMHIQLVEPSSTHPEAQWLYGTVERLARQLNLPTPEVGIYESPELNAFATGPTKKRSLVAVSSGLLQRMSREEVEGVL